MTHLEREGFHRMKLSDKLDALQEIAKEHAENVYTLHLVELLVENAEDEECTKGFLEWVRKVVRD